MTSLDDTAILRLLDGLPPLSPEEAAVRAPYERLIARLAALPDIEPPPGWEDRAVKRWHRRIGGSKRRGQRASWIRSATMLIVAGRQ